MRNCRVKHTETCGVQSQAPTPITVSVPKEYDNMVPEKAVLKKRIRDPCICICCITIVIAQPLMHVNKHSNIRVIQRNVQPSDPTKQETQDCRLTNNESTLASFMLLPTTDTQVTQCSLFRRRVYWAQTGLVVGTSLGQTRASPEGQRGFS